MRNIRIGQPVTLSIDMFPNLKLKGVVESMGAGSGVTFSLLPPQNSTGNWVKITQRFPVKVSIDNAPKTAINGWNPLKVGSSVVVTIDAREPDKVESPLGSPRFGFVFGLMLLVTLEVV